MWTNDQLVDAKLAVEEGLRARDPETRFIAGALILLLENLEGIDFELADIAKTLREK